jgi:hypothetical protein
MKHKEHICGFNDGEQSCECYDDGFKAGYNKALKDFKIKNKYGEKSL